MSNSHRWVSLVLSGLLVLYPLLVYLGLTMVGPRWLAALLLVIALGKLAFNHFAGMVIGNTGWLLLAASVATAITLVSGSVLGLKFYPVLVNGLMLILFSISLWRPPSMIERFARLQHQALPPAAVRYTRKVTWIWCVFFIINGSIATLTVFASESLWALYNGFIAYMLMGLLLAGEYLVRKHLQRKNILDNNELSESETR